MLNTELKQKLESLATQVLTRAGGDLIELKVSGHARDVFIQITADKPLGGITIEDCAIMNRSLADAIENERLLPPEVFSLEVSSPGLDRPLLTRRDFMRFIGRELHFWLKEPLGAKGKKETQGILNEVGESALTIDAAGTPGLVLPLAAIIKGQLVIE